VVGDATLSDKEGWQVVGRLKAEGAIKTDFDPSPDRLFSEIASYYLANKEWKNCLLTCFKRRSSTKSWCPDGALRSR